MNFFSCFARLAAGVLTAMAGAVAAEVVPLTARGDDFTDPAGKIVKLWGVNLVSFYPDKETAVATAENLAELGVNCARPHHMLRPGRDWNPQMLTGMLMDNRDDSFTPDPDAWDRFFFLTSELRKKGIYLLLSVGDTRKYLPGDVKVMDGGEEDNLAWQESVRELNARFWKDAMEPRKMMALFDERAARVVEKFTRQLLTTVNPYTGRKFAEDPQLLTLELFNEFDLDYMVICRERLPEYQYRLLLAEWEKFLKKHGAEPFDFDKVRTPEEVRLRMEFMREVQTRFFRRMEKVIRECGYRGPILYSNLWRGEPAARFNAELSDSIEDHYYIDPRVYLKPEDLVYQKTFTKVAGKPYIIGEINHNIGRAEHEEQNKKRAMLPLATAANAAFQGWSGIVWFAWCHGGKEVGPDGWAVREGRSSARDNMVADGMMIDHLKTAGLLFRNNLVRESIEPVDFHLETIPPVSDYHTLVRGSTNYHPGWQSVHAIRKVFGKSAPPEAQARMRKILTEAPPANLLVSDTGEVVRDLEHHRFLVKSPAANGFAGELGSAGEVELPSVAYRGQPGFAVFLLVSADGRDLAESGSLLLSRTTLDPEDREIDGGVFQFRNLSGDSWSGRVTRPRESAGKLIPLEKKGELLELPADGWHEIELTRRNQ